MATQTTNELAVNLKDLFDLKNYKEFKEGDFINHPNMRGYYFLFKKVRDPKFCVILNTSNNIYPSDSAKVQDYFFIVFNITNEEEYMGNFAEKYFPIILTKIDENMNKKDERTLPYGYYFDENRDIKVDIRKANEVRKIYDMYIETESIRHIAGEFNTNFSFIRDILHDNEEYAQMTEKILAMSKIKKVNELLAQNVRGRMKEGSSSGETEELRRIRKQKNKEMKKMQAEQQMQQ